MVVHLRNAGMGRISTLLTDAEGYEANLDVVCAGWFALYIDEDREEGGFSFQQWPLAQCYVTSTRRDGIVDTIYRRYQLTAEQAIKEFGADKVSKKKFAMRPPKKAG